MKRLALIGLFGAAAAGEHCLFDLRPHRVQLVYLQGRSVPAGTYILQVRATTSNGEAVRVVQPFALFR